MVELFVILLVVILASIFFLYKKLAKAVGVFIMVVFFASITLIASVIFLPQPYDALVSSAFASSSVGQNLQTLDTSINDIRELQANGLLNTIIGRDDENAEPIVESDIYSQVVEFTSSFVRMAILLLSLILLSFAVYSRFAFAGAVETASLEKQIAELRKEVDELKKKKPVKSTN